MDLGWAKANDRLGPASFLRFSEAAKRTGIVQGELMANKLKIGIIGSGGIAQGCHMPGYRSIPDDCEMVAVCDANEKTAKTAAEKFSIDKVYTDYKELLADPEIDAVSVATPNAFHVGPTVDALKAGKHVLCEKPLGMNAEECRQMCRAAKDSGKILQVALQTRFSGAARFLKDYIDAGNMGDIYYARAQALRRRGVPGWGVFIDKEKQGGGPLIDIGVHILDITLHFMGYPKPVSAVGKTWDTLGKNPGLWNAWGDYDRNKFTVEDFAVGLVKFDNGAVVVLESSFMGNLDGDPFRTQLFGTKAGATFGAWGENPIEIYTEVDKQLFNLTPKNVPHVESAHTAEVQAFVKAIQNSEPSPVPGENGLILNAIFDAIYKSSETGNEEKVDVSY
jgi:predicted dehydrogenase